MSNLLYKGKSLKGFVSKAKEILFNNKDSGLDATNVQDAIEELDGKILNYEQGIVENVGFGISYITFEKNHANPIVFVAPIEDKGSILVSVYNYGNGGCTIFAKNVGDYPYSTFGYKYLVIG